MKNIGLYIHIPFCKSKCPYCDFYSIKKDDELVEKYTDSVISSIKAFIDQRHDIVADTLYFGGGTPSIIGANKINQIIDATSPLLTNHAEITVECNPSDNMELFIPGVASNGVNRISLGMQSAVTHERRKIGRISSSDDVLRAIDAAKSSGIDNISVDLMLGTPDMTIDSLDKSLDFIKVAGVPHVSAYMLKIEEGTPFHLLRNKLNIVDEDTICDMYLKACEYFSSIGLDQYEISNFALDGYQSRHNTKYWRCEEYLGIGASAHSYIDGRRFFYSRDIYDFINGEAPLDDGKGGSRDEEIMLGLRLTEGIEKDKLTPLSQSKLPIMIEQNLIKEFGGRICMTPKGFLLSNTIIAELID